MNETDFLTHISNRLGRPQPLQLQPEREVAGAPEFWTTYCLPLPERLQKFRDEVEKLGGTAEAFESVSALRTALAQLLKTLAPNRVGTWGQDAIGDFHLEEVLQPYPVCTWGQDSLAEFEQVDVSVTGCAFAVADTGTVVMMSSPARGRSVAVLPSVHIILMRQNQLRTRLGEVLAELSNERHTLPSSVHFISGPSRSSDIENDQSIGVHGPAAVHVLILTDETINP